MNNTKRYYNFNGYKLSMQKIGEQNDGKYLVSYTFKNPNGELLFDGKDFSTPAIYNPLGKRSAIQLLGFLTLKKGDTDKEYFDKYSAKQLAFSESMDCEELQLLICDYENK